MMRKTFRTGDTVVVGKSERIPVRYQGRTATVVGREKFGKSFRYLVSFGARRLTPLPVPSTKLALAE